MKCRYIVLQAFAMAFLSGCASIQSFKADVVEAPTSQDSSGLYYYMPMKRFLVTLTLKTGDQPKVVLAESSAYADLSKGYVLRISKNLISHNTVTIGVTETGLLTSANTDLLSGVADTLKALASVAGTVSAATHGLPALAAKPKQEDCADGDHVFVVDPTDTTQSGGCGLTISVARIAKNPAATPPPAPISPSPAGVYYRQALPYLVTVSGTVRDTAVDTSSILFSPSESPIHFLPVAETFFADNHAELTFTDGMPTKFKLDVDGEFVAMLKLPADVIAAYFDAVGKVFNSFKATDTSQVDALNERIKLELAKQKYAACLAAITAQDTAKISALGCSGS